MKISYSKIDEIGKHQHWLQGLPVHISELIDGIPCSYGLIKCPHSNEWIFRCWQYDIPPSNWVKDCFSEDMMNLLTDLCNDSCGEKLEVVVYCTLVVPNHRNYLDYGATDLELWINDIKLEDKYLNKSLIKKVGIEFNIRTTPILQTGSLTKCMIDAQSKGISTLRPASKTKSTFKDRKGIIITPVMETDSPVTKRRLIEKVTNPAWSPK